MTTAFSPEQNNLRTSIEKIGQALHPVWENPGQGEQGDQEAQVMHIIQFLLTLLTPDRKELLQLFSDVANAAANDENKATLTKFLAAMDAGSPEYTFVQRLLDDVAWQDLAADLMVMAVADTEAGITPAAATVVDPPEPVVPAADPPPAAPEGPSSWFTADNTQPAAPVANPVVPIPTPVSAPTTRSVPGPRPTPPPSRRSE